MTEINISKIKVDENNLIIKDAQARENINSLSTNFFSSEASNGATFFQIGQELNLLSSSTQDLNSKLNSLSTNLNNLFTNLDYNFNSLSTNLNSLSTDINNNLNSLSININSNLDSLSTNINSNLDSLSTLINSKQDKLSFDTTPTNNSNNLVKSGALYTAFSKKANSIHVESGTVVYSNLGGDSVTTKAVTFNTNFSNTGYLIFLSLSTNVGGYAVGSMMIGYSNKTQSGFTCRIYNASGTAKSDSVQWVAIQF